MNLHDVSSMAISFTRVLSLPYGKHGKVPQDCLHHHYRQTPLLEYGQRP